jgi:hypothetical protein
MDNEASLLRALGYAAFASLGGMLGHLMRTMDKKQPVVWPRAVLEGISAGFVGVLTLFLCDAMKLGAQWTGVIVGVFGWLGATVTIRLFEIVVKKRFDFGGTPPAAK